MARYMPQDLFDGFAIAMALEKVATGKAYQDLGIFGQYHTYKEIYPEDDLFFEQVLDTAIAILDGWQGMDPMAIATTLKALYELRQQLDENLDKLTVVKRTFRGAAFGPGHPNPADRVAQAIRNINIMAAVL